MTGNEVRKTPSNGSLDTHESTSQRRLERFVRFNGITVVTDTQSQTHRQQTDVETSIVSIAIAGVCAARKANSTCTHNAHTFQAR